MEGEWGDAKGAYGNHPNFLASWKVTDIFILDVVEDNTKIFSQVLGGHHQQP